MKHIHASATVSINHLAQTKKAKGEKVYNFAAGDPSLSNSPRIINSATEHINQGLSPYPPVEGLSELRNLVAEWMNKTCNTAYNKNNVLVTTGGKLALLEMLHTFLEPHAEVLIPSPYWVSYPTLVKMAGGIPKIIHTEAEKEWKITAQDLLTHLSSNTKILILNNACNPTGTLYSKGELTEILSTALRLGLIVISDEVYSGLVYEEEFVSCGSFEEYREHVLIVQSCSKNFGMAGWRIGFAIGPEKMIKLLSRLQSQTTTGTCLASQWAAIGALENAEEVNFYVKNAMRKRKEVFVSTFNLLFPKPIVSPKSALYVFIPIDALGFHEKINSIALCEKLIEEHHIAVIPGIAFGKEGYVRFAFSEEESEIHDGLHHLKLAVDHINGVQM